MYTPMLHVRFKNFPDIKESVINQEPYYWQGLSLDRSYRAVSDYEKIKDGKSEHFLLIIDDGGKFIEVPLRDNVWCQFAG